MGGLDFLTPTQVIEMMMNRAKALDEAQKELAESLRQEADAEHAYRLGKAKGWVMVSPEMNVAQREAWVNGETADLRHTRDIAVGRSKAWMEQVRNVRQQLSALQSAANSLKEEAAFSRVGPGLD